MNNSIDPHPPDRYFPIGPSLSSFSATKSSITTGKQQKTKEFQREAKHVIFYNIYTNQDRFNQTLRTVEEQMSMLADSVYFNNSKSRLSSPSFELKYNLWNSRPGSEALVQSLFPPTATQPQELRPNQQQGGEVDTLQDLYEHCLQNPKDVVIYIHNKGSLNPTGSNHRIRKIATKSALSRACQLNTTATTTLYHQNHPETCNVCVNKFHILPNHHTSGNMWTAQCSYVQKLIPPDQFDKRRQDMFRHVRQRLQRQEQENDRDAILYKLHCVKALVHNFEAGLEFNKDQWKYMSIDRYAMEHWIFSHPTLVPCFTIPSSKGLAKIQWRGWDPTTAQVFTKRDAATVVLGFERATTTGWYQLEGRKYEYQYLYQQLPPSNSFVWELYKHSIVLPRDRLRC